MTNNNVRGVNGQRVYADIVAVLDGECDIGWSRNADDGSFDFVADVRGVAIKYNQAQLINSINQKYAINKSLSQIIALPSLVKYTKAGRDAHPTITLLISYIPHLVGKRYKQAGLQNANVQLVVQN